MTRYHLRTAIDVSKAQEDAIRAEHGLPLDAPLIHTMRTEVWEALIAAGHESGHWSDVTVT